MSNFRELIKNEMDKINASILNFPWENKENYANWLTQTYRMVCHSTRLVAYASGLTELSNQKQHHRFLEHALEEKSHEILCINDLKALAKTPEDYPETASTKALYQCQYYLIDRKDPTALFGYVMFLEYLSTIYGKVLYDKVKQAHGAKAGQFLRVHSEEDEGHIDSALKIIDSLPETKMVHIYDNLSFSSDQYRTMLTECAATYVSQQAA